MAARFFFVLDSRNLTRNSKSEVYYLQQFDIHFLLHFELKTKSVICILLFVNIIYP